MFDPWFLWLIAAIVLIIVELLTLAAAAFCLAVGCLAAIIPALFGASLSLQIIFAIVGIVVSFIFLVPVIRRLYACHPKHEAATNMDAMIGRTGVVTEVVTESTDDNGRVKIDGVSWQAYTRPGFAPLMPGTRVVIKEFDSIVLRVEPKE